MKNIRQSEILKIIQSRDIDTQEQLLEELRARGFTTTQATISRDIKQLHLIKEPVGRGRYRYAVSVRQSGLNVADKLRTIFRESVLSIDCAQNIVVVKTLLGLANGAAAALDSMELPYLVGTLAGEDTVLLVMRDSRSADGFCAEIGEMLPLSGGDQKKE